MQAFAPFLQPPLPLITQRIDWSENAERTLPVYGAKMDAARLQAELLARRPIVASAPDPALVSSSGSGQASPAAGRASLGTRAPLMAPQTSTPSSDARLLQPAHGLAACPAFTSTPAEAPHDIVGSTAAPLSIKIDRKYEIPQGQPGKQGRGGYDLENKLKGECHWSAEEYEEVGSLVLELAPKYLNQDVCFRRNKTLPIAALCLEVRRFILHVPNPHLSRLKVLEKHPFLRPYRDHWPIKAFIKLHLKATSRKHRTSQADDN
ncbi:unnamed protein product [Mycena citricolor]|uniref:Uncharacterized protein n=1 Tax=Mycena citricolor TaxID=2018698 RepID=A0AAD2HUT7_9AGAR|nr:unnamed protein product [Mycena citricolor]CAK5282247.1 unnamed protein product [Mycena citricolor]